MKACRPQIRLVSIAMAFSVSMLSGCHEEPHAPPEPRAAVINAAQARALVLAKYTRLFARAYYHIDDEYHQYPELSEADLREVTLRDDGWDVRCDPLAGLFVIGRVAKEAPGWIWTVWASRTNSTPCAETP